MFTRDNSKKLNNFLLSNLEKFLSNDSLDKFPDVQHLFRIEEDGYNTDYKHDLLEQYKIYVESVDRAKKRNLQWNYFFLSLNVPAIGGVLYTMTEISSIHAFWINEGGYRYHADPSGFFAALLLPITFFAMMFSIVWSMSVQSFKNTISTKMKIIYLIEKKLPMDLFYTELEFNKKTNNQWEFIARTLFEMLTRYSLIFFYLTAFVYSLNYL